MTRSRTLDLLRRGYAIRGGVDNVEADPGTGGATFATDDIAGVHYPRSKVVWGADGAATDASAANPLPVVQTGALPAGDNNVGNVDLVTVPAPLSTTGGGTEATALRVTVATDSTGVLSVDDNGASLTVDGPLTDTELRASAVPVSAASLPLPTGASTLAEQQTQTTALQLIDDTVYTDDTSTHATGTSKGLLVMAAAAPTDAAVNANDIGAVAMTTDRKLHVSVQDALPAGSANIGDVDVLTIAAGDNNIGNVDIVSVPAPLSTTGGGTEATALRVTVASDSTGVLSVDDNGGALTVDQATAANLNAQVVGAVAHDANTAVNPVQIGLRAESSPKGITLVADADVTHAYGDVDGIQITKLNTANGDIVSEAVSNTDGASTAFTNFSAVASTRNYVTAITVFRTDAGTSLAYVDFRDGTAGSVLWRMPLPPDGGSTVASAMPLFKTTANTALAFDVSAALTTVYISVSGFQSKA